MRNFKEYLKQMEAAHCCDKCRGKMFAICGDMLGNTRCAYCNEIVHYPSATEEELLSWMKEKLNTIRNSEKTV